MRIREMIIKDKLSWEKMEYLTCRERGTKKKSESPTGIEPMTFRTPVGRSYHWATGRLVASIGHIYWVVYCLVV